MVVAARIAHSGRQIGSLFRTKTVNQRRRQLGRVAIDKTASQVVRGHVVKAGGRVVGDAVATIDPNAGLFTVKVVHQTRSAVFIGRSASQERVIGLGAAAVVQGDRSVAVFRRIVIEAQAGGGIDGVLLGVIVEADRGNARRGGGRYLGHVARVRQRRRERAADVFFFRTVTEHIRIVDESQIDVGHQRPAGNLGKRVEILTGSDRNQGQ